MSIELDTSELMKIKLIPKGFIWADATNIQTCNILPVPLYYLLPPGLASGHERVSQDETPSI